MLHLRQDWQGIQDVRQWLLPALIKIEDAFDEVEDHADVAEDVYDEIQGIIARLLAETGDDPEKPEHSPGSSIEDDELVFMVRAKTNGAYGTVIRYAQLAIMDGATEAYGERIKAWADQMRAQRADRVASGTWVAHAPDAPSMLPYPDDYKPEGTE